MQRLAIDCFLELSRITTHRYPKLTWKSLWDCYMKFGITRKQTSNRVSLEQKTMHYLEFEKTLAEKESKAEELSDMDT